jgi:hypothetical protein
MAAETRHDPIATALDELRSDVGPLALAPADAVRRRGEQRGRNRRVALTVTSVAAVAAVAVGTSVLMQPVGTPRPAPPASGPASTGSSQPGVPTASTTPTASASAGSRPVVTLQPAAPGGGTVPAAYFLPGRLWQGPDLNHGRAMVSIEPRETEGSVSRFACDPDADLTGDVAFLQVQQRSGLFVGTQEVRLLGSVARAGSYADRMASAMPQCQSRLRAQARRDAASLPPGETAPVPNAEVREERQARVDDATGTVRVWRTRTDYGTGAGSAVTDWVVLVRQGAAASFLSLPQLEGSSVTSAALLRIAAEARQQLRWAATQ